MCDTTKPTDTAIAPGTVGLLLAAGRGRRMGGAKQLTPWGDIKPSTTLVAAARQWFCKGNVQPRLSNDPLDRSMAPSSPVEPPSGVLLQLADHPKVAPETVRSILAEAARYPTQVIIPDYDGRGGHPIWIPGPMVKLLGSMRFDGGLRTVWTSNPELCRRLPVDDPWVVRDVDYPEDCFR